MKQDLTINQLMTRVSQLARLKKDYLVPTNELRVSSKEDTTFLDVHGTPYVLQERAAAQLSSIARIPYSYFQRLQTDYPDLLDANLNRLLADQDKPRMVRTLGAVARAVLSDRYRKVEHETLLDTLLPLIADVKGLEVVSASLTTDRLYLKAVCKYEQAEVRVGDAVAWGIVCMNSETGCSSIVIQPYVQVLKCTNGMVLPQYQGGTRKIHLGKQITNMDEYEALYADEEDDLSSALKAEMDRILDSQYYMTAVQKMKDATAISIPDIHTTLQKVTKLYALSEDERKLIFFHYHKDKDFSLWGLVNAVTETSKAAGSYVRAHQLETIGSQLLYEGVAMVQSGSNPLLLSA